jgi:hypothetical protein
MPFAAGLRVRYLIAKGAEFLKTILRQAFTAIMAPDFELARRDVDSKECEEVGMRKLIDKLNFIENKQRWGYKFRFGFFEINQADFELIAGEMLNHLDFLHNESWKHIKSIP